MAKKTFYTGPEIAALSGPLTAAQTAMIVASFKIAARVANAAWAYVKAMDERQGVCIEVTHAKELRDALHEYSPGNWAPTASARAYAAERLEELYNEASQHSTADGVLETIYKFARQERE